MASSAGCCTSHTDSVEVSPPTISTRSSGNSLHERMYVSRRHGKSTMGRWGAPMSHTLTDPLPPVKMRRVLLMATAHTTSPCSSVVIGRQSRGTPGRQMAAGSGNGNGVTDPSLLRISEYAGLTPSPSRPLQTGAYLVSLHLECLSHHKRVTYSPGGGRMYAPAGGPTGRSGRMPGIAAGFRAGTGCVHHGKQHIV